MDAGWTTYWMVAGPVVLMAALITWQTVEHRRFVRSRIAHPSQVPFLGRIALMVPCKGPEPDLENNLRPLFEQDFGDYCLRFVVESADDCACVPIRRLLAQHPRVDARLMVAGVCSDGGQKVHNLLHATARLPEDVKALAFVDTDISPPSNWLRLLTQHLNHDSVATGYRCMVPQRMTLANCLLACMNSAGTGLMFPNKYHRLVWGGSWAIRREVFEGVKLREAWQGTLSDDMVATRVLQQASYRVSLEPACLVASPIDMSLPAMFSFLRRQLAIGRCCTPLIWCGAILLIGATQAVYWGSLIGGLIGLLSGFAGAITLLTVAGTLHSLGAIRAWLRFSASKAYAPQQRPALAATRNFEAWLGPLVGLATMIGLAMSAIGRRIVWRGIHYEMYVGGRAKRLNVDGPAFIVTIDDDGPLGKVA